MEHIKDELVLKNITLKNRLVLPPMASGNADADGKVTEKMLHYYDEKSHGGYLSLVIVEHSFVSEEGRASVGQLSISNDSDIDGLSKLTEVIHKNGSKVVAQLNHAGGATNKSITGHNSIAPSLGRFANNINADCEMTKDDIARVIESFTLAADRAIEAGFDGVEIHSAHSYLLNQFYSPLTNLRQDEYGGGIEGRIKIHLDIIDGVRSVIGEKHPLLLRLGACDYMEGGSQIDDAVTASKRFEHAGIDILDISGGLCGFVVKGRENEQGYFSDVTEVIKQNIKVPVILTGGIRDIKVADRLIEAGKADLIGIGRAMYKDSYWAEKALTGYMP